VPVGESGGTGQLFGFVPFSFMVKMLKGKHFFIVDGSATYNCGFEVGRRHMRLLYGLKTEAHWVVGDYDQGENILMIVPVGESGGTGQLFGFVPFSFMVKMLKGKHFFIDKATGALAGKA
jgi:hypothetical protein